jgi:TRAP-type C4-dicarboxylate transport system substrate-binding protein
MAIYVPMVSLDFWRKLTPEHQAMMTDVWGANIATYRTNMAASQARARDALQAHGIKISVPDADAIAAVRQRMMAEQDAVAKSSKISPEMVAAVMEEIATAADR